MARATHTPAVLRVDAVTSASSGAPVTRPTRPLSKYAPLPGSAPGASGDDSDAPSTDSRSTLQSQPPMAVGMLQPYYLLPRHP